MTAAVGVGRLLKRTAIALVALQAMVVAAKMVAPGRSEPVGVSPGAGTRAPAGEGAASTSVAPHRSPYELAPDELAPRTGPPRAGGDGWRWTAALGLVGSVGLLVVAISYQLSRSGRGWAEALFWAGLLIVLVPFATRLASRTPSRGERIALLALLAAYMYLVKVLHDPFGFMFSDELIHQRNAEEILRSGSLFGENSLLPVTAVYPGLETAAAAIASLAGVSVFTAGLLVVGSARVAIAVALFLVFERIGGSARLGAVASLVYLVSPNLLFFSYQFSYESLALPLGAAVVFAAIARADARGRHERLAWTVVAVLLIGAIVATHHLTSYSVAVVMLALLVTSLLAGRRGSGFGALGLVAALASGLWAVLVAPETLTYLGDIFSRTSQSVVDTASGSSASRALFRSPSGESAPAWEPIVAIVATALTTLASALALPRAWRWRHRHPLIPLLALAALGYPAFLLLRFASSAWETGNRASAFLFIGVAWMVALAGPHVLLPLRSRLLGRAILPALCAVVLVGGVLSSWSPSVRLSQPFRVSLGGTTTEPEGAVAARWTRDQLGPGNRIAAPAAEARLLLAEGRQTALTGSSNGNINVLLSFPPFGPAEEEVIDANDLDFVLVDRRTIAFDNIAGYFFGIVGSRSAQARPTFAPEVVRKFDVPRTDRLYDSGDVTIYDLRRISR